MIGAAGRRSCLDDWLSGLDRDRSCPWWLHQMRSGLGRLDATVEILQLW